MFSGSFASKYRLFCPQKSTVSCFYICRLPLSLYDFCFAASPAFAIKPHQKTEDSRGNQRKPLIFGLKFRLNVEFSRKTRKFLDIMHIYVIVILIHKIVLGTFSAYSSPASGNVFAHPVGKYFLASSAFWLVRFSPGRLLGGDFLLLHLI